MKNFFTLLLLLIGLAESFSNTFYDQLFQFNPNWEKKECQVLIEAAQDFNSDKAYVPAHLKTVLKILQKTPLDNCNLEQYESRIWTKKKADFLF